MLDALRPVDDRDSGLSVIALAGLPGVGKTALALHAAHVARDQGWFPGGALFVDLHGYDETPGTAEEAVLTLLGQLGVNEAGALPMTADGLFARYRSELAARDTLLIVVDNVGAPAHITHLLPGEGRGHSLIVTSRDAQDSLPVRQFVIEVLTPDAACLLVDKSLRRTDPDDHRASREPDATRELAELCGGLPLALLISVALLRRRKRWRSIATLTAELRAATDRVQAFHASGVDQYRRELALQPVFDVMYRQLDPELRRIFRLLGQAPSPHSMVQSAAALVDLPRHEVAALLDDLAAASVVTVDPLGNCFKLHDLVWLYAHRLAADDPEAQREAAAARQRFLEMQIACLMAANHCIRRTPLEGSPDLFSGSTRGALQWLVHERPALLSAVSWTRSHDPEESGRAMDLALLLSGHLCLWFRHTEALHAAQAANTAAIARGEGPWAALAADAMGTALDGLGRHEEALALLRDAQRAFSESDDPSHEAGTWINIGATLRNLRRFTEAASAYEQGLRMYREPGNPHKESGAQANYSDVLLQLGRQEEAHKAADEALDGFVSLGDKLGEAKARAQLGDVLSAADHSRDALREYLRALTLYIKLDNLYASVVVADRAALTLHRLQEFEAAATLQSFVQHGNVELGDACGEATASFNCGLALLHLGRVQEALAALQHARAVFEANEDWPGVGHAWMGVATIRRAEDDDMAAARAVSAAAQAYDRAGDTVEAQRVRDLLVQ
ncbi:tetratricopeptide repeat protein [Streptomyces sp. NPDC047061]|uniref:tetratricopeptide repeat protein n=1 Tax=Streptomyces sp. NPDC047061 TaxID=3154605 RepID=UPI0033F24167